MTPLQSMWLSFIGLFLMFVAAAGALFGREKLNGVLRFIVLSFSFVCILIAGLIVLVVVVPGSRATL
ncbi:DUF2768 domain-containing protein [Geomicrobium sp. JCM 19039]|uniref:DUF2768 domain-containing protein n=1 Tax=Geomicrobium sp. JCM 19039 TaxID=1460636 RepID=UPI00045F3082|nr:DUF2768 domain-containing protein [Geomicrobium sp. JCM 19039]GAK11236.1 hypothetical protein JCM19039_919 [Geomicrobium sp. JCM 19039]